MTTNNTFVNSTLKITASETIDIQQDLDTRDPATLTIDDLLNEQKNKN